MRLADEIQPIELCFAWEQSTLPERVPFADVGSARAFLARLALRGHGPALHRLLGTAATRAPDDAQVIAQLAAQIATGRLLVLRGPTFRLSARDMEEAEEEPAQKAAAAPAPVDEEAPAPEEEALPPAAVDGALQARTLRRAAEKGTPFCEECERKARKKPPPEDDTSRLDQAAMARTLVRAAAEGVPVCEECERLKKAPPDSPPPPPDEDDEDDEDDEESSGSEPRDEGP